MWTADTKDPLTPENLDETKRKPHDLTTALRDPLFLKTCTFPPITGDERNELTESCMAYMYFQCGTKDAHVYLW